MLPRPLVRYRRAVIVLLHLLLVPVSYFLSYALRFGLPIPAEYLSLMFATLPLLIVFRMAAFAMFGLFRGWWRHVGVQDLVDLVKAITLSSVLFLCTLYLTGHLHELPRSIFVINWGVAILVFGGARFGVRLLREGRLGLRGVDRGTPALVVGAGEAGARLVRELQRGQGGIHPVGMVDDDPLKHGMRIHGVPVLGGTDPLRALVERTEARLLIIAVPSADRATLRRIVDRCLATGVEFKLVPSLRELLAGKARLAELRRVEIEDLLGREPVRLELRAVAGEIAGATVLVTGAAGSIGSELARQIATHGPKRLVLVEQAESPLYFTHLELREAHPQLELVPVVADITDGARMDRVFESHRPELVFHAAAYKHVPLMEDNVREAVRNNVFGTLTVAESAVRSGARRFVLISTDKAVKPSSVMGATKRIAERIVLGWPALQAAATDFRAVRFGNVLGSNGSVVPLFRKQLAAGGPLTVTHPEVTRYFMTIPEAVQLVLQAGVLPEAERRICMLEMGEPVRIVTLAENLVRLSGLEPYVDVPIVFTGLRPGEKLYEELMSEVEATVPTTVEKIRVVQTDEPDGTALAKGVDRLAAELTVGDEQSLVRAICALVPECVPPLRDRGKPIGPPRRPAHH